MSTSHYTKPTNPRFVDLTGQTFERLEVLEFVGTDNAHHALWRCKCSCGNTHVAQGGKLRCGEIRSCGCLHRELAASQHTTHGDCGKSLYNIYNLMLERCRNPNVPSFKDYGARGITVCEEWLTSYVAFREWALTNGYVDGLTIERIKVNESYSPENCTWIPKGEQARNKTNTVYLTVFGETKTMLQWADDPRCKIHYHALRQRVLSGWDHEEAISTPKLR